MRGRGARHAGIAPLGTAAVELLGYPWNGGMKEGHDGFALDGEAVKKIITAKPSKDLLKSCLLSQFA